MDTKFFQGSIFKITAKHSGKVLDIPSEKMKDDNAPLQQWNYGDGINQKFLIFPVDDVGRYFVIASLASGKVIHIPNFSISESEPVVQYSWSGGDNQLFELNPVSGQSNTFYIRAKHSGKILDISGESKDNGAKVLQYKSDGGDNERFIIEKVGDVTIDGVNKVQAILSQPAAADPSEFPALTSPQKPQSSRNWKPVGKPFLLPYFMVNDNNPAWQVQNSPYYLLSREVCYTLNDQYFTYNNTASEQEYEVTIRAGFTTEESENFSKTTGLEVANTLEQTIGAKVGAETKIPGFGKVSGEVSSETSFSLTASASLSLGYSTSTSLSRHNEQEIRRLVKCQPYTSLAGWTQTSRFTLLRLDGSRLKTWEVLEGGVFIDDIKIPQ
ncbi:RICIN domain-containing protein [Calothrix sp. PCC 7507]|uniref:RICIN domain-containing protein n=1 Tax=Calothrix sp. PCC 7507 TaxID=99598 RepID=UPI00029F3A03|nr:RICIN domain-containing protein [Calothrix sp. PCC 7507]AFY32325.1 Ricin B lectin [Calothrix sp. PCC 7507]